MKKVWLSFVVVAAMLVVFACTPTSRVDPLGSNNGGGGGGGGGGAAATPTPAPVYTILSGGTLAPWMGLTEVLEVNAGDILGVGPANPLNGGLSSTQITVPCDSPPPGACNAFNRSPSIRLTNCPRSSTGCQNPVVPAGYLGNASVDFDLKIDVPLAEVNGVWIYWGNVSCYNSYRIPSATLSNSFAHYSIPINSFIPAGVPCSAPRSVPLQVTLIRQVTGSSGAGFCLDNVIWHAP